MAQNFQITEVGTNGTVKVLHPESNADQILTGVTNKVPTITNVNDWIARSQELIAARKGKTNLKLKIDEIDTALQPANLLASIKQVDGSGSGLDADFVDGKTVNDTSIENNALWTAEKIYNELGKKTNSVDVVKAATPNKILMLNANGNLPANITGNSNTATSLKNAVTVNLTGDASGSFVIQGGEAEPISMAVSVADNSHNHNTITSGANSVQATSASIAEFKKNGTLMSKIDLSGNFTGSANKVNNISVNDNVDSGALWTNTKILKELGELADAIGMSSLDENNGTIVLSNLITIQYGKVPIAEATEVEVAFHTPFKGKVLFDGYSIETSDSTFVCYKAVDSVTNEGIIYDFNQAAVDGALTWFAVGI